MSAQDAWREPLYEALKAYQRGEYRDARIGVGILPTDLSAVYVAVERAIADARREMS